MHLYAEHIARLGFGIGQFPVRDWFWERVPRCADAASFVATMGLGVESANLEHAASFAARFREAGDEEGARLQERIGREEIAHVRFGVTWFRAFRSILDFETWRGALPAPLSPMLMRGKPLQREARMRAGQSERFSRRAGSMAAGFAWLLNLDADVELAALASAGTGGPAVYEPTRSVREAARRFAPGLAAALLDPERDLLVDDDSAPQVAQGMVGRAFCPTPRALRILRRAGAEPEPHPACEVLVRVNARAFASSLGTTLPGADFVADDAAAREKLGTLPPRETSATWRVKRNFGMAGRGQRVVDPSQLTERDMAFVRAGLAEGGVQIEPNVTIVDELRHPRHPVARRCAPARAGHQAALRRPGRVDLERATLGRTSSDRAPPRSRARGGRALRRPLLRSLRRRCVHVPGTSRQRPRGDCAAAAQRDQRALHDGVRGDLAGGRDTPLNAGVDDASSHMPLPQIL